MASRYEVELKLVSATNLKNVNWRNGPIHPCVVVWVEPNQRYCTNIDEIGNTQPTWDETLVIPLPPYATIKDSILCIDVLHAHLGPDVESIIASPIIIGSTKLRLKDVHNYVGVGHHVSCTMNLKRPSGRPQGAIDIKVAIKDNGYPSLSAFPSGEFYHTPFSTYLSPFSTLVRPPNSNMSSGHTAPPIYNEAPYSSNVYNSYSAPPITGYSALPIPYGGVIYGQSSYWYGQDGKQSYGYGNVGQQSYGHGQHVEEKSKIGVGAGLVVGAEVGGLGALALDNDIDMTEDKIVDHVADNVKFDM